MVGARDDDLDRDDGANDDDRELEWLCRVFEVPDLISGGRSRIDGGEIDLLWLLCLYGDGLRLWLGAGRDSVLWLTSG